MKANPFTDEAANRVQAFFLDEPPPENLLETPATRPTTNASRRVRARSLSRTAKRVSANRACGFPPAEAGTARNMNTVAKLAELAREMS